MATTVSRTFPDTLAEPPMTTTASADSFSLSSTFLPITTTASRFISNFHLSFCASSDAVAEAALDTTAFASREFVIAESSLVPDPSATGGFFRGSALSCAPTGTAWNNTHPAARSATNRFVLQIIFFIIEYSLPARHSHTDTGRAKTDTRRVRHKQYRGTPDDEPH